MVVHAFITQQLGGEGKQGEPQGLTKLQKEFQEASGTQNPVLKDKQGKKQNKSKSKSPPKIKEYDILGY